MVYRDHYMEKLVNKVTAKEIVAKVVGKKYIIKNIGIYHNINKISPRKLPNKFIMKANHGAGLVYVCKDKDSIDWRKQKKLLENWLSVNHYYLYKEWVYKNIEPKIIIEELLLDENNNLPYDYKIYCFNGNPKIIEVHLNRFGDHSALYLDINWNVLPFIKNESKYNGVLEKPKNIEEMLEIARELSKGFPFMRVDFYLLMEKIYFGEMTFYPGGGFTSFNPPEWDYIIGDWFDISTFYNSQDTMFN